MVLVERERKRRGERQEKRPHNPQGTPGLSMTLESDATNGFQRRMERIEVLNPISKDYYFPASVQGWNNSI